MPTDENRRPRSKDCGGDGGDGLRNSTRYVDFDAELTNINAYLAANGGANATRPMGPDSEPLMFLVN